MNYGREGRINCITWEELAESWLPPTKLDDWESCTIVPTVSTKYQWTAQYTLHFFCTKISKHHINGEHRSIVLQFTLLCMWNNVKWKNYNIYVLNSLLKTNWISIKKIYWFFDIDSHIYIYESASYIRTLIWDLEDDSDLKIVPEIDLGHQVNMQIWSGQYWTWTNISTLAKFNGQGLFSSLEYWRNEEL